MAISDIITSNILPLVIGAYFGYRNANQVNSISTLFVKGLKVGIIFSLLFVVLFMMFSYPMITMGYEYNPLQMLLSPFIIIGVIAIEIETAIFYIIGAKIGIKRVELD